MDDIKVRYGEAVNLPIDADDDSAVLATLYVGLPGQTPKITVPATLTDGVGEFELGPEVTRVPLGKYRYQITVIDSEGKPRKYPDPDYCDDCDTSFPLFIVAEALDETEVVS